MGSKYVVAKRDECLIGAFSALHLRLSTDSSDPLIQARRRIASLSALRILPPSRKYLLPTSEQAPEERYFLCGRRGCRHPRGGLEWLAGRLPFSRLFEQAQPVANLGTFPVERRQSVLQGCNLSSD